MCWRWRRSRRNIIFFFCIASWNVISQKVFVIVVFIHIEIEIEKWQIWKKNATTEIRKNVDWNNKTRVFKSIAITKRRMRKKSMKYQWAFLYEMTQSIRNFLFHFFLIYRVYNHVFRKRNLCVRFLFFVCKRLCCRCVIVNKLVMRNLCIRFLSFVRKRLCDRRVIVNRFVVIFDWSHIFVFLNYHRN